MFSLSQPTERTQKSSLQLGVQVGGHMALTDFHLDDLSELSPTVLQQMTAECCCARCIAAINDNIATLFHGRRLREKQTVMAQ